MSVKDHGYLYGVKDTKRERTRSWTIKSMDHTRWCKLMDGPSSYVLATITFVGPRIASPLRPIRKESSRHRLIDVVPTRVRKAGICPKKELQPETSTDPLATTKGLRQENFPPKTLTREMSRQQTNMFSNEFSAPNKPTTGRCYIAYGGLDIPVTTTPGNHKNTYRLVLFGDITVV
jgi:hypothetical protein